MLCAYLIVWAVMSLASFVTYAYDKMQARRGKWRVKEATLLLLALFMGAPGALIAMRTLRHKTLKAAKPRTADQPAFQIRLFHSKALAHGHRKSIHTDANRQQQQFSNAHKKTSMQLWARKHTKESRRHPKSRHFRPCQGRTHEC